jgi:uncharacterized protein (TIGR03435 family)
VKKLTLWIFTLALLSTGSLFAQSLVGTWQGTLAASQAPGGQLRIVLKVSTTPADKLQAVFYSIDQTGQPFPVNSFTAQGSSVKMSVVSLAGNFDGKVSADANSIAGTWTQGPMPIPLTLERVTTQAAWAIPDPPKPPKIMAADASPAFEVVTIKPQDPAHPKGQSFLVRGDQISLTGVTLHDLLTFGYGVHPRQISGGPSWLDTDKFEILGKPDTEGQPNTKQLGIMLQKLLADRFELAIHHDKKELTVYAITVGKTGPKLTPAVSNGNGLPGLGMRGFGRAVIRNATIGDFAGFMQSIVLDRPVVDQTKLDARYDFTLDWTPDETQFPNRTGPAPPPPAADADSFPDLFTAMQQQLGLKMESTKAPVDVIVIDKVEKPSDN